MILGSGLELHYAEMDALRISEIEPFLRGLSLTVESEGGEGIHTLFLDRYKCNNSCFSLTPINTRVNYTGFETLGRKYKTNFGRMGHEGKELVDEIFVGFRKDSYTGIFLRTGPVINPDSSLQ